MIALLIFFCLTIAGGIWLCMAMIHVDDPPKPKPIQKPVALPAVPAPKPVIDLDEWRAAWGGFEGREELRRIKAAEYERESHLAFVRRQEALRKAQERREQDAPLKPEIISNGGTGLARSGRSDANGLIHHRISLNVAGLDAYYERMMDEVYLMHHTYQSNLPHYNLTDEDKRLMAEYSSMAIGLGANMGHGR